MSLTKIVATFAFAIMLSVAFSSSSEVQAQSSSRSGGGIASGVAGSGSRALPSVVTDFGGTQEAFSGTQQTYIPPQAGVPVETQFSGSPVVSSGSDCGCSAAPAPVSFAAPAPVSFAAPAPVSFAAPAPVAAPVAAPCGCSAPAPAPSPCGGGCGSGCRGGCGNSNFGTLRRGQPTGIRGGLFQRGRPCSGCN